MDCDTDELVHAIQYGPLEASPWKKFVALLRLALKGNYANLIFRQADQQLGGELEVHDGEAPNWLASRYLREFAGCDPIPYFDMIPGHAYCYEEFEGIGTLADDPFRRDFLLEAGFEHFLIFRVAEPGGCNIWVTITRALATGMFLQADRDLCARLAAHLSPALACHTALLRAEFEKTMYQRAADMLSFGVMTLDATGQVLSIDAATRRRLQQCDEILIVRERLCAPCDDKRLNAAIRRALATNDTQSCHIGDVGGIDLLIMPVERRLDGAAGMPRLLVYLSARENSDRDASRHLAGLFDLSQTQARLAMLLVNGKTLQAAATAIGITEQTARTYSKEIYQRTGTSRQGELIQRILTSVAMLD
jgi:DNA-binding CsgD family transcriptional regulator